MIARRPAGGPSVIGQELSNGDLVEAVARRVVELLAEQSGEAVSAAEIARRFGVSRDWVYAHGGDLGAVPIGDGPRPRLRFYPERVSRYLAAYSGGSRSDEREAAASSGSSRPRKRGRGQNTDLLPIRDRQNAAG